MCDTARLKIDILSDLNAEAIDVGDFVYCRSPYLRRQLGIPKEAGLVLEVKRSNYRTLYGVDQFCWLPRESIVRVEGKIKTETLAGRLHFIIKSLDPLDCELVSEGDLHRATLRIDHIDLPVIDELRNSLGPAFVSLSLVPEGMAFMLVEIGFREGSG